MLRLGSRSKDEVVSQYSLETVEKVQKKTSLHAESSTHYREMKHLEQVSPIRGSVLCASHDDMMTGNETRLEYHLRPRSIGSTNHGTSRISLS